jgi:transposase
MGSEILSTVERRRPWPAEEKLRIMSQALEPGATVAAVADSNGVCRSQLYTWLKLAREGRLSGITLNRQHASTFVPVRVEPSEKAVPAVSAPQSSAPSAETRPAALTRGRRPALVEVVLTNGRIVKVDETIDPDALARLLCVLDGGRL